MNEIIASSHKFDYFGIGICDDIENCPIEPVSSNFVFIFTSISLQIKASIFVFLFGIGHVA